MLVPSLIVIDQDHRIGTLEVFREMVRPLAGTARIAGGSKSKPFQVLDVLFAFRDQDRFTTDVGQQIGQVIGDQGDSLHDPFAFDPSAFTVSLFLSKRLEAIRLQPAANPVSDRSICLLVMVISDEPPLFGYGALRQADVDPNASQEFQGGTSITPPASLPDGSCAAGGRTRATPHIQVPPA
jgi:hypothetical protein